VTFRRLYNIGRTIGVQRMPKSVPFKQVLNAYLQDPDRAVSYLISALEEDPVLFETVMQDIMKAQSQAGRSVSFITKLADHLQEQGVEEKRIQLIVAEMSESFVDAA
jgi:predicted metal-dependent phosphotriesterase family hydrolase